MNDKELLELAAKAAGYSARWHDVWQCFVHENPFNTDNPPTVAGQLLIWSPLTDDGDALRLAVKLHMDFTLSGKHAAVAQAGIDATAQEFCNGDPQAATRRAIVRAAAKIGAKQQAGSIAQPTTPPTKP